MIAEARLALFRSNPLRLLSPARPTAAAGDLLDEVPLDFAVLPYNKAVTEFIQEERRRGRKVVLAAKTSRHFAGQVAQHLPLFDDVIATGSSGAAAAVSMRELLLAAFGPGGFDYAGSGRNDALIRDAARRTVVLASRGVTLRDWLKAIRVHQWLKNLLIFVPLLGAHRYTELPLLSMALLAFLAFGLCASSVYVLNDLLDLPDDRHHAKKRLRPFASGRISVRAGMLAFPLLLLAAFSIAVLWLPRTFLGVLAIYYFLTLTYSLVLKRRMVFDVMTLAGLYTLRIVAGAIGLAIPLTFWLLALSMFTFLSLALVKRYTELFNVRAKGDEEKARGRGYYPSDLQMIASLGAASGYLAVMVLALYINDARTKELYRHVELIWLACPLLLTWFSRVWMMAHRGFMDDDPVIFAIKDRISLALVVLTAFVFWLAA
jgi:4-hydroxybenzoate polyprenyltransferase